MSALQKTQVCTLYCMKESDDLTSIAFHHHCRALQSCVTSALLHPAEFWVWRRCLLPHLILVARNCFLFVGILIKSAASCEIIFVSLYIALHHRGGLVRHSILGRTSGFWPNMGASILRANLEPSLAERLS